MSNELSWSAGNELLASLGREQWLADRIKSERMRPDRRWSQARLSQELAKHGCAITQPAISNIESPPKGEARRSISIDEAIAFSKVFGIPVGELLLPPQAASHARFYSELAEGSELLGELADLRAKVDTTVETLAAQLDADPELSASFQTLWNESEQIKRMMGVDLDGLGIPGDRRAEVRAYMAISVTLREYRAAQDEDAASADYRRLQFVADMAESGGES